MGDFKSWRWWVAAILNIAFILPFLLLSKLIDILHEVFGSYGKFELYITHPFLLRLMQWSKK